MNCNYPDVLLVATLFIFSNKHVYGFATKYQDCSCQRGHYMEEDCLGLKFAKCQPCPPNTFNPFPNRSPSCQYCKNSCIAHASVTHKCTPTSDKVCHCDTGFIEKHNACIKKTECECAPGSFVDENALQSCTCKPCRHGTYNSNKDNSASCADCSHDCPVGAIIITSCNTTSDRVCACKPGYRKTRNSITSNWACVRSMDTSTNPTTTNLDSSTNLNGERKTGRGRNVQGVPMLIYIASCCATVYITMVHR